jgi:hypothetical protein
MTDQVERNFMAKKSVKDTSANNDEKSIDTPWPRALRIANRDEFQQCLAVADLAIKLCELQKRELQSKWEAEDKTYKYAIKIAVTEPDKKRVNEERDRQMELRLATLAFGAFC